MRLVSLNVALYEKNNILLPGFLRHQQADIICLQEVTRRVDSSTKPEYISKPAIDRGTKDLTYAFYAPLWLTASHESTNYHDDDVFRIHWGGLMEFGNYVKSRYPIEFATNVFVENNFSFVTDWTKWPEEDYRAVQVVDLIMAKKPLRILNYHGIWTRDKQGNKKTLAACRTIKALADQARGAVIIAGDFNLLPDTASMGILKTGYESLVDRYNIQTTRPTSNELSHLSRNVIDYMFINDKVEVKNFEVLATIVSDHLPLVMDFEIR